MRRRFGNTPKRYGISLQGTRIDDVHPQSETNSIPSQFVRGRVLRSQCMRRRTSGSRRTLQTASLQRFCSSRDGFRFGTTHSAAQRTRRTQAYRNTMHGFSTVDARKTSLGGASEHKRQHCRSLHETSGWTENAVARKENWTSNLG